MKRNDSGSGQTLPPSSMGERIKDIRVSWRWSQAELANALRIDQASISFWEHDKVRPSGSAIVALASLFRTSVEALEDGSQFQIPDPPFGPESLKANREVPRSVSLPVGSLDLVAVVDLGEGSYKDLSLSDSLMALVQGVKERRRTWVVLE